MRAPRLSVILPNYNHGRFLSVAIDALANQSVPPDEIIIIDDGSTDDSIELITEAIDHHPSIRLLRNENNQGVNASVAWGRREAKGEFIYFAAADDRVLPGLFENAVELLTRHHEAGVCTAMTRLLDTEGRDISPYASERVLDAPGYITPECALTLLRRHGAWFMCNTAVYRRELLEGMGGFDPRLESYADSFLCSVIALRHGVCFVPKHLGAIRIVQGGYSAVMTGSLEPAFAMFGYAKDLMQGCYRELFPLDYISLWEARWRYAVASGLIRQRKAPRQDLFKLLGNKIPVIDSTILTLTGPGAHLQGTLADLYMFLRLTPGDFFRAIGRRLRRLLQTESSSL